MLVFVSFIGIYAGHFLFSGIEPEQKVQLTEKKPFPVVHKHISTKINGAKQEINILEIDVTDGRAVVKPVLSFDSVFGYEKLSSMASRESAYAAVNAGFFYEYGRPSGMVCIDNEIIVGSTGAYPVFCIENGKASLKQIKTEMWITTGVGRVSIDGLNIPQKLDSTILYTSKYGSSNRAESNNISAVIENNFIKSVAMFSGNVSIPTKGMLLSIFEPTSLYTNNYFKQGEKIEVTYHSDVKGITQAYECGSWIVKDGKIVVGSSDPWVGLLTNRDPRTAIGIKHDGKVLLVTVDGRQSGYSEGMTARELGQFLLRYGAKDVAMLDGGASTTMIMGGEIINRPSYKGKERPLGGGIIVKLTDKTPK